VVGGSHALGRSSSSASPVVITATVHRRTQVVEEQTSEALDQSRRAGVPPATRQTCLRRHRVSTRTRDRWPPGHSCRLNNQSLKARRPAEVSGRHRAGSFARALADGVPAALGHRLNPILTTAGSPRSTRCRSASRCDNAVAVRRSLDDSASSRRRDDGTGRPGDPDRVLWPLT